jgi:hypothetical protein
VEDLKPINVIKQKGLKRPRPEDQEEEKEIIVPEIQPE